MIRESRRRTRLTRGHQRLLFYFIFSLLLFSVLACNKPAGFGVGGRYSDAMFEISKPSGNMGQAVNKLEYVVRRDPLYRDSLTLLGRAYYRRGRYQDAFQMLKRALAVHPKNEVAWIAMGLTQLRLGQDKKGLESLKGGITLLNKVSRDGYKDVEFWDKNGLVRHSTRKVVFYILKGLGEKPKILRSGEILLVRITDELLEGRKEEITQQDERD